MIKHLQRIKLFSHLSLHKNILAWYLFFPCGGLAWRRILTSQSGKASSNFIRCIWSFWVNFVFFKKLLNKATGLFLAGPCIRRHVVLNNKPINTNATATCNCSIHGCLKCITALPHVNHLHLPMVNLNTRHIQYAYSWIPLCASKI